MRKPPCGEGNSNTNRRTAQPTICSPTRFAGKKESARQPQFESFVVLQGQLQGRTETESIRSWNCESCSTSVRSMASTALSVDWDRAGRHLRSETETWRMR